MKYHLGCGRKYRKGFINVDTEEYPDSKADIFCDLLKLNMGINQVDNILSNHVFEHFGFAESMFLLYKWTASLKVGGVLTIGLPDLQEIFASFAIADIETQFKIMRLVYGDQTYGWGYHKNGWSAEMLSIELSNLGYRKINVVKSKHPNKKFPNHSMVVIAEKWLDIDLVKLAFLSRRDICNYCNDDSHVNSLQKQFDALMVEFQ